MSPKFATPTVWRKFKLGQKLAIGFGCLVCIAGLLGYMGWSSLLTVEHKNKTTGDANQMLEKGYEARLTEKNFILHKDKQALEHARQLVTERHKAAEEMKVNLREAKDREAVDAIAAQFTAWLAAVEAFASLEDQKEANDKTMVESANAAIDECAKMRTDQKQKLQNELATGKEKAVIEQRLANADDANRLVKYMQDARRQEKNYILRHDDKYLTAHAKDIDKLLSLAENLKSRFKDEANIIQIDSIIAAVDDYRKAFTDYVTGVRAQQQEAEKMVAAGREIERQASALRDAQTSEARQTVANANHLTLGLTISVIVIGFLVSWGITRGIVGPVRECMASVTALSNQDFSKKAHVDSEDEIGQMAEAINQSIQNTQQAFADIQNAAEREKQAQAEREEKDRQSAQEIRKALDEAKTSAGHLNSLPTPFVTIDTDFNVTFINRAGAKVLGSTPEQCQGKKCYELFRTPHCQTDECRCKQAMQKDGVFVGETVADPHGLNLPIQYTAAPIKDADGRVAGAMEFVLDISETKTAIEEAKKSVDNLNNLPTPVMTIDKDYNVTFMNPAGADVVGLRPEECVGRKCHELFKTPHCRTEQCACHQAMMAGERITTETVADPNGLNLPIMYTGAPIKDAQGHVIGALEYVVDITEIKTARDKAAKVAAYQDAEVEKLSEVLEKMSAGDLTAPYSVAQGDQDTEGVRSAFSGVATSLNRTLANLGEILGNIKTNAETLASSSEELLATSTQMASNSEEMTNQAGNVAGATSQVSSNISTMAAASEEMSANAQNVSSGAEQMSQNMNSVASAIEEMSVAINDIAENTQGVSKVSDEARKMASSATQRMSALGEASKEIGQVTEVIKRIAEQTNLLALNATIEAASAGDAGKGFAVVANEIKELANQSAQAAEDIAKRIQGVQGNTDEAVTVIDSVAGIIEKINESALMVAQTVDQQTQAANNISSNVQQANAGARDIASSIAEVAKGANDVSMNAGEAAKGANDVSSNIQGVNKAATDSAAGAQQVNASAEALSRMAAELQEMVDKFTLRSAV